MPRFFIDTDDGDLAVRDEDGLDLSDPQAARDAAHRALPDMARQKMPDGDRREFRVTVRNEDGAVIYEAALSLVGSWYINS